MIGGRLLYGGDYNPEQWPEEIWIEDVRLMQRASVNFVSLGIFSWAWLESRPGDFVFDGLDRVLALLHEGGIRVNLATATASPPPWLTTLHPEARAMRADGTFVQQGSRQHYAPASPAYRYYAQRLVRAIAKRYAQHPAVVSWHINNEYACHVAESFDPATVQGFRYWLERRYGNIETLNDAWGTAFWSQRYGSFAELGAPVNLAAFKNPAQALDWRRYSNWVLLDLFRMERDAVREFSGELPINTNFLGFAPHLDYFEWAGELDYTSWDSYPDPAGGEASWVHNAMCHDLTRSLKRRPFVLMEQATSQVNWRSVNSAKRPGQMATHSYQALARGADGICFFQWRASRAGAEKFHSAMVPHTALQSSRTFAELERLGQELARLAVVVGSEVRAQLGIVFDWPSRWALAEPSKPARLDAVEECQAWYLPLFLRNVAVDFVQPEADLTPYRVLIVPALYLLTAAGARNLSRFVAAGGTLVVTFFSGIVDEHEQVGLGGYPALLRETLGMSVEEWAPLIDGEPQGARFDEGGAVFTAQKWSERVELRGAVALAQFTQGFLSGHPAITRYDSGAGTAYYVATRLDEAGMSHFVQQLLNQVPIPAALSTPRGVEASVRHSSQGQLLFLINHSDDNQQVTLPQPATDPLTGQTLAGDLTLAPCATRVLLSLKP